VPAEARIRWPGPSSTIGTGTGIGQGHGPLRSTDSIFTAPIPGLQSGGSVTRTISSKTDWFATATARVGFAWDRVLLYSKGGVAVGRFKYGVDDTSVVLDPFGGPPFTTVSAFRGSDTRIGWTVGAGVEWAVWGNVSAKVEYAISASPTSRSHSTQSSVPPFWANWS
jgi:opacity protein-like surface antigen